MSESEKYILTAEEIEAMSGLSKTHFLNDGAKRVNKSLGDVTGLTGLGFHIIEVQPGDETTEYHRHHYEDECVYVLQGEATVTIGDTKATVAEGGFIGYRANGEAHTMTNSGASVLKCIVVGQRLAHEVVDYPRKELRMYNNQGKPWDLVKTADITHPVAGRKS